MDSNEPQVRLEKFVNRKGVHVQQLYDWSAADFAFLLHGFHFLKDEGVMAIILPHGVLFRSVPTFQ